MDDVLTIHEIGVIEPLWGDITGLLSLDEAALWEIHHEPPFIDGDKRVAITDFATFLSVNGFRLDFTDADAYSFLIGLYETGRMRFAELDAWLISQNHVFVDGNKQRGCDMPRSRSPV